MKNLKTLKSLKKHYNDLLKKTLSPCSEKNIKKHLKTIEKQINEHEIKKLRI